MARACFVGLYDFSWGHGKLVRDDEKSQTLSALQQSCHAPARPAHSHSPAVLSPFHDNLLDMAHIPPASPSLVLVAACAARA